MKRTLGKISFDADKETLAALKPITKQLGRGNQAEGIRRALIETAERLRLTESLKAMDAKA